MDILKEKVTDENSFDVFNAKATNEKKLGNMERNIDRRNHIDILKEKATDENSL